MNVTNYSPESDILGDLSESKTLRKSLPSYRFFRDFCDKIVLDDNDSEKRNEYFCPLFVSLLVDDIMPLSPLWSPTSSLEEKHASNAEVEGSFSLLKRSFSKGQRFSKAVFLKECYVFTKNCVLEVVIFLF